MDDAIRDGERKKTGRQLHSNLSFEKKSEKGLNCWEDALLGLPARKKEKKKNRGAFSEKKGGGTKLRRSPTRKKGLSHTLARAGRRWQSFENDGRSGE